MASTAGACHICTGPGTASCANCHRCACAGCSPSGMCILCILPAHAFVHTPAASAPTTPRRARMRKRRVRKRRTGARPVPVVPGRIVPPAQKRRPRFTVSRTVLRERMRMRRRTLSGERACADCGFPCARCMHCARQMCVSCSDGNAPECGACETALQAENDTIAEKAYTRHMDRGSGARIDRSLVRWRSAPLGSGGLRSRGSEST